MLRIALTADEGAPPVSSTRLIQECGLPTHEAVRLLQTVTGLGRANLVVGEVIDPATAELFGRLSDRRRAGTPLQYLEGTVQFGPLEIMVDRRALIPRPETEQLWELATELVPARPSVVVDMGTGSGCLAIALAHDHPQARVIGTDISSQALDLARLNAALAEVKVDFRQGDRLDALPAKVVGRVDLIVTNPPYLSEREWEALPAGIRQHEPRLAFVSGDGLDMYRYLASAATGSLVPGGWLVAEVGDQQAGTILEIFERRGWRARTHRDWREKYRFLIAQKPR